ncbi:unnamed protein product [Moneuplotes crassus]|uniref:Uncharacterized protein n=1 Tax=Euplotes crassus TaxID=5936 RepID=A0AAD1X7V7_EUPCR|nr:unnamed protein product [Moneuplotes crassus]
MGYNSLLFNEQLSSIERDLEAERKTIEKREEVLSTLELQLTSKNNEDENYMLEEMTPKVPKRRGREESPKVDFDIPMKKKRPISRKLFNYNSRDRINKNRGIENIENSKLRKNKIKRKHQKNCQLVRVTTKGNKTKIEGKDSVFFSINKVQIGRNKWKKCKILEIDGISEDWTEEQYESVIVEESDPNCNTSSSLEIKPIRESKYQANPEIASPMSPPESPYNEPKEESKEEFRLAETLPRKSHSSREAEGYTDSLKQELEPVEDYIANTRDKSKILERRRRFEQKMIETKSISETLSYNSNLGGRAHLYCCNGAQSNGMGNCTIF